MKYDKAGEKHEFFFNHDINIRRSESDTMKPHYHDNFEIYFITEGICTYFIDNRIYQLQRGDLILIPQGILHYTKYNGTVHSRMLINCPERFIPASVRQMLPSLVYLYRNPGVFDDVNGIFQKIEQEYNDPDELTEDILICYTNNLFFLLARNLGGCEKIENKNRIAEQAIEYLQSNFSSPITLTDIAGFFSVSPEHFSRMFKKETGFGFNKYLNTLRLQKAEALLKKADDTEITRIATECGFEDSNYFSKKFKEMYGISPQKLKALCRSAKAKK